MYQPAVPSKIKKRQHKMAKIIYISAKYHNIKKHYFCWNGLKDINFSLKIILIHAKLLTKIWGLLLFPIWFLSQKLKKKLSLNTKFKHTKILGILKVSGSES
jgi:hypothetical protein